jgi:hypothetical protein
MRDLINAIRYLLNNSSRHDEWSERNLLITIEDLINETNPDLSLENLDRLIKKADDLYITR